MDRLCFFARKVRLCVVCFSGVRLFESVFDCFSYEDNSIFFSSSEVSIKGGSSKCINFFVNWHSLQRPQLIQQLLPSIKFGRTRTLLRRILGVVEFFILWAEVLNLSAKKGQQSAIWTTPVLFLLIRDHVTARVPKSMVF